jgi:WD40 repeat protein
LLVVDPETERRRIEATKGGLLDDSFRWVLDNAEFQKWHSDPRSQLLWIKGDAGKGKTMLMIGIVNELLRQIQSPLSESIAYFLCQATDPRLNNATSILRSLIYMLIQQRPHLISHLRERYDTTPKLFVSGNIFYSLSAVFESMIQDSTQAVTYLLVDALDECETDTSDLLRLIARTKSMSAARVKWIVSSRNRDDIEQELDFGNEETKLSLELNANHISNAVVAYINHKVSRLKPLQRTGLLLEQVKEQLLQKSNGTFLWVALVVQEMQKCQRSAAVVEVLERTPRGLIPLYNRMIQQIQLFEGADRELCTLVLSIATLGYRPLHLHELCRLTGLHNQQDGFGDLENIVGMCGSFLTIRDNYVYLIHQSAKDYLSDVKVPAAIFPLGPSTMHHRIFRASLQNLSGKLRRNIYNLDNPGTPVSEIATLRPYPDPLFDLRYSCTYWLEHFLDSTPPKWPESLSNQMSDFFKQNLLHWLESLGLIGELRNGILSLKKLSARCTQHQAIFQEAERFASANAAILQEAPLQIYSAALVFCPQKSLSKRLYWDQRFDFIGQVYVMQETWNPCLQVLEGHRDSVRAVAFSPDGQTVVSGSSDRTIRLWDTATGAEKQTFEGHESFVCAIAFTPDGQLLASASDDETIRLWDMATGAEKQTLKGHGGSVNTVTFSPDGQTVASASYDGTMRLWDTATGEQTLMSRESSGDAVAFSPDGQLLASASDDGTIQLWDMATRAEKQTLKGQGGSIYALAFSPNGRVVASASHGWTIRLWDTATGAEKQALEGHGGPVYAVAFSPDGQIVASASSDRTIRLWNTATGVEKQTLKGHGSSTNAVAFSPNGQLLASASDDETIRLWDTATGAEKQTLKGHGGSVNTVASLPDRQTVVSASSKRTIRLWDTATDAEKQTIKGHKSSVFAVALSPDGRIVASASQDMTIRLWDAATGAEKQTLEGHGGPVYAVAFSPDGQIVASASYDRTIRLWDTATSAKKQTFNGHKDLVDAVAFSLDGQTVASTSHDKTIRLWDTATGAEKQTLEGHGGPVFAVAFSPDGQIVASASSDRTIRLWDTATGSNKQTLNGHRDLVTAVAFSPDGQTVASASCDKTIRLWDLAAGIEKEIHPHSGESVTALWFSADGCCLNSDRGSPFLEFKASDSLKNPIFVREKWIRRNGQDLIWLPPQYRATCVLAREETVILGHQSGALTFLWFKQH